MQTPSKTTELEAVNVCLSLMGSSPVSSLLPPYGADVANARNILTEISKRVQAEGWHFNTEHDYTLYRDADNRIPVASNIISIDADTDWAVDVVERNGFLYDRTDTKQTDIFDHDVKCEVTLMFAFDELPETARQYIMICAARKFQARYLGSENQHAFTELDETRARVNLEHAESDSADVNMLNSRDQAYIARRWQVRRFGR